MITKLTKAQEKKIPVYLRKWLKVGYRTKTTDRKKANKAVTFLYEKIMKLPKPKYIIHLDSPMAVQLACNSIKNTKFDSSQLRSQLDSQLGSQLGSQLYSQLRSQLGSQLYSQLGSQLYSQLRSQLDSQLYSQLGSQLYSQLDSQLGSQLDSQLGSQLGSQLDSQLRSQLGSQLGSQKLEYFYLGYNLWWYGGYYGFYDFVLHELFPKKQKDFKLYKEFINLWPELHQFVFFPEIAFVSDFPKEINLNKEHRLHSDNGPALLYRDTYSLFRLNGISVDETTARLKPEEITKDMILKQPNADIRREIVRKLTAEQLVKVLDAKVLDKKHGYELLGIDLGDNRVRNFLSMTNPSLGIKHIEGIIPGKNTIEEALAWRNGLEYYYPPEAIT